MERAGTRERAAADHAGGVQPAESRQRSRDQFDVRSRARQPAASFRDHHGIRAAARDPNWTQVRVLTTLEDGMQRIVTALLTAGLALSTVSAQQPRSSAQPPKKKLALVGGMLIDGYQAPPVHHAAIVV